MTVPPPNLLFPSGRFVAQWLYVAFAISIVMIFADGANWAYLSATIMAALWAVDCLGRLRGWLGGALVPGYAATGLVVVLAIISSVVVLGALLSHAAGNPTPAFALAMFVGMCTVLGLTYAERRGLDRVVAVVAVSVAVMLFVARWLGIVDTGMPDPWPAWLDGVLRWAALGGAAAATIALRRRLERPPLQSPGARTVAWQQYRSHLVAPRHVLGGWYSRTSLAEWLIPGVTIMVVVPRYLSLMDHERGFHGWEVLIQIVVWSWLYVGSLTPLMLVKGAGTWLGTAWRIGHGASRPALGRAFAARVGSATAFSFSVALTVVLAHAYLGNASVPPIPRHLLFFEEVFLVYAVGLLAATWALTTHPPRTATQPYFAGPLAAASAADAVVFFMAPETGATGLLVLACFLLASGALLAFAGGRAIARVDFVVRKGT